MAEYNSFFQDISALYRSFQCYLTKGDFLPSQGLGSPLCFPKCTEPQLPAVRVETYSLQGSASGIQHTTCIEGHVPSLGTLWALNAEWCAVPHVGHVLSYPQALEWMVLLTLSLFTPTRSSGCDSEVTCSRKPLSSTVWDQCPSLCFHSPITVFITLGVKWPYRWTGLSLPTAAEPIESPVQYLTCA